MPDVGQPLKPPEAKALIRAILEAGGVRWGDQALKELAKDYTHLSATELQEHLASNALIPLRRHDGS